MAVPPACVAAAEAVLPQHPTAVLPPRSGGGRPGQHLQRHFFQAGHLLPLLHQAEAVAGA